MKLHLVTWSLCCWRVLATLCAATLLLGAQWRAVPPQEVVQSTLITPVIEVRGVHSAIRSPEYHVLTSASDMLTMWNRHMARRSVGSKDDVPVVDFSAYMVVAAFAGDVEYGGSGGLDSGLHLEIHRTEGNETSVRVATPSVQTATSERRDRHEPATRTTVSKYAWAVIPRLAGSVAFYTYKPESREEGVWVERYRVEVE